MGRGEVEGDEDALPARPSLSRLTPLCPVAASWSLAAALPGRAAAAYVLVARRRPGDSPILVTDLLPPPRAKEEAREGIGGGRRERDWLGFHPEPGFVPREFSHRARQKSETRADLFSPTDLWPPAMHAPPVIDPVNHLPRETSYDHIQQ